MTPFLCSFCECQWRWKRKTKFDLKKETGNRCCVYFTFKTHVVSRETNAINNNYTKAGKPEDFSKEFKNVRMSSKEEEEKKSFMNSMPPCPSSWHRNAFGSIFSHFCLRWIFASIFFSFPFFVSKYRKFVSSVNQCNLDYMELCVCVSLLCQIK